MITLNLEHMSSSFLTHILLYISRFVLGFRSLLQQLVQVQRDTLEVSRQRLQVETKRVTLEQSMGARILNILQTISANQNNNN